MADCDVYGLIIALTTWLADPARANLILNPTGAQKREIYSHHLPDDSTVAAVATVVRLGSASPRLFDPFERLGVQILTRADSLANSMARSLLIYRQLIAAEPDQRPLRGVTLNEHWYLHLIDPIPPQPIAADPRGRWDSVINVNIQAGLQLAA